MKDNISHKEMIEKFILFEKNRDLFKWKYKDIPVWELIRYSVFMQIKEHTSVNNKNLYKLNLKKIFKFGYQFFYNIIFHNPFFLSTKKNVLILNHPRRKKDNDIYIDIYTDPWLSEIKNDYIILESIVNFNFTHYKPIKTNNIYYLDILQLPSLLFRHIPLPIKFSQSELLFINEIETQIINEWNINGIDLKKIIYLTIKRFKLLEPFVEIILNKIQPSKIVNVVSYSFINQVYTYVAKKKNIPVSELQHGTVGQYHIAYNMGVNELNTLETFPDYFLSWGKEWIKNSRMPIHHDKLKLFGFPYFESYKVNNFTIRDPKKIVIISQYRKDIEEFSFLVANHLPNYTIIYKPHPLEYIIIDDLQKYFEKYPNVQISANNNDNLYDLFCSCSLVIGVNSTALAEAIPFCPNIYILKFPGWEYYEDIEESKSIKFINNISELLSNIESINTTLDNINISSYFEYDSIAKISNFINDEI